MEYDLLIPCAPKDYVKIELCISQCLKHLIPKPRAVYIVAKHMIKIPNTIFVQEDSIFNFSVKDIKYRRPNWIYQQLIKLCQDFTVSNYYLCLDSDTFIQKDIELFAGNKQVFFHTREQHHQPYFNFMSQVFNLEKQVNHTFIADITMFNKKICREIIPDPDEFLKVINPILSDDCLIGEPEIYGNYLAKYYPQSYVVKQLSSVMMGRFLPEHWTKEEIDGQVQKCPKNVDIISLHSWS